MPKTFYDEYQSASPAYPDDTRSSIDNAETASLLAIYGGSLRARHLACLKRLAQAPQTLSGHMTSLTVFHLVEMGLLARDAGGDMCITSLGASLLADHDRLTVEREAKPDAMPARDQRPRADECSEIAS